ncbi:TetR/AcrR family transcriptional regulator [Flagellimonas lutimaris]|uniref:TetR/AcrR family transcriptional regulator n=1 Tax=Flagellimonas lutimaris TaxID=475082 RepID=A0A3A1N732_9FLAO|nr:TetR/AcrR family transcriptional regulator [Allomuricauda lutimaris]RIV31640.1 TetR/AcrR family transcriptional regulator [Allomuricauda lutimaris]
MNKAQQTRKYILETAFSLVYENGFQSTSIDKIIAETNVTKGAFYYHFKNKEEMGMAIINEILTVSINENLVKPLANHGQKAEVIYQTIKNFMLSISDRQLRLGCPTNNMIQEMAPLNTTFARALLSIIENWKQKLSEAIIEGQKDGSISPNQDAVVLAAFIISSYEGARTLGKLYKSFEYYNFYLKQLKALLEK